MGEPKENKENSQTIKHGDNMDCNHESEIRMMREELKEIRKDVKSLLQFKWQVFGGTAAISFMTATLIGLMRVL
jgi:hypothetical protein